MMKPPWEAYPDYERRCMGWRMGGGEGYMDEFIPHIRNMGKQDFLKYVLANPEPEQWVGFLAGLKA